MINKIIFLYEVVKIIISSIITYAEDFSSGLDSSFRSPIIIQGLLPIFGMVLTSFHNVFSGGAEEK